MRSPSRCPACGHDAEREVERLLRASIELNTRRAAMRQALAALQGRLTEDQGAAFDLALETLEAAETQAASTRPSKRT